LYLSLKKQRKNIKEDIIKIEGIIIKHKIIDEI